MSLLETLQQEIADQISADPFFQFIPVFVESLKSYETAFNEAMGPTNSVAGRTGACVTVLTPTADVSFPDVGGPEFTEIPIILLVQENKEANQGDNGTQQSALTIAEQCCARLHQFFPLSATGPLICEKPTIIRGPDTEYVNYNVRFKTRGGLKGVAPQLAQPLLVNNAGVITLTPPTPGAAVFYTLNGTNATPRNANAILALNPFTPPPGSILSVRAWLAGYLASQPLTQQF